MPVTIHIPTIMRSLTNGAATVDAQGSNLADVIDDLERDWPGVKQRLVKDNALVKFMNLYVNDQDVRFHSGLQTPINEGDEVIILPAVAGGQINYICKPLTKA